MRRPIRLLALSSPLLLALSCVTTTEKDLVIGKVGSLEFPDQRHPWAFGTYHNVQIVVERSRPLGPLEERPTVLPFFRGRAEVYNFEEGHEVLYLSQRFNAGGFWYPSWPGATLFLFGERPGDWTFRFRGIPITVESPGSWRPAVLWRAVYEDVRPGGETGAGSGARPVYTPRGSRSVPRLHTRRGQVEELEREEFLVGSDRFELDFRDRQPILTINHKPPIPLRVGMKITLTREGDVRLE